MNKRRQLAKSLDGVVRELRGPVRLPGASPLNRVGMCPYEHELVSYGGSPLYDRTRVGALPATIERILATLELG